MRFGQSSTTPGAVAAVGEAGHPASQGTAWRGALMALATFSLGACQIYDQVGRSADPYLGDIPDADCLQSALATADRISAPVCVLDPGARDPQTACTYTYAYADSGTAEGRVLIRHATAHRAAALDHRIMVYQWSPREPLPADTEQAMIGVEATLAAACALAVSDISRSWALRPPRTVQD